MNEIFTCLDFCSSIRFSLRPHAFSYFCRTSICRAVFIQKQRTVTGNQYLLSLMCRNIITCNTFLLFIIITSWIAYGIVFFLFCFGFLHILQWNILITLRAQSQPFSYSINWNNFNKLNKNSLNSRAMTDSYCKWFYKTLL